MVTKKALVLKKQEILEPKDPRKGLMSLARSLRYGPRLRAYEEKLKYLMDQRRLETEIYIQDPAPIYLCSARGKDGLTMFHEFLRNHPGVGEEKKPWVCVIFQPRRVPWYPQDIIKEYPIKFLMILVYLQGYLGGNPLAWGDSLTEKIQDLQDRIKEVEDLSRPGLPSWSAQALDRSWNKISQGRMKPIFIKLMLPSLEKNEL